MTGRGPPTARLGSTGWDRFDRARTEPYCRQNIDNADGRKNVHPRCRCRRSAGSSGKSSPSDRRCNPCRTCRSPPAPAGNNRERQALAMIHTKRHRAGGVSMMRYFWPVPCSTRQYTAHRIGKFQISKRARMEDVPNSNYVTTQKNPPYSQYNGPEQGTALPQALRVGDTSRSTRRTGQTASYRGRLGQG